MAGRPGKNLTPELSAVIVVARWLVAAAVGDAFTCKYQTVRGLPGIIEIEYDPHYCQYGWTAVSVWLDLFCLGQVGCRGLQISTLCAAVGGHEALPDSNLVFQLRVHNLV